MIIILDDTFIDRHKYHDISFLEEDIYKKKCLAFSIIKTTDFSSLIAKLDDCKLLCNHKTLQLYDKESKPLSKENNIAFRESLLNQVSNLKIRRVEFSRGLETNFEANKIDKDLFYSNLKIFLDYYLQNGKIEEGILFYGSDFKEQEKLTAIQNMMGRIRSVGFDSFAKDDIIIKGISLLYPHELHSAIFERWKKENLSKSNIIKEINNQIK
jgi:hypothetical protein